MRSLLVLVFMVVASNATMFNMQFDQQGLKEACGLDQYTPYTQDAIDSYLSDKLKSFKSMTKYCRQKVPSNQVTDCYEYVHKSILATRSVFAPPYVPNKTVAKDVEQVLKFLVKYSAAYFSILKKLAPGNPKYMQEGKALKRALPLYIDKIIQYISDSYKGDKGAYCKQNLVCSPEEDALEDGIKSSTCQCYLNPSFATPCALTIRRMVSTTYTDGWSYIEADTPQQAYIDTAVKVLGTNYDRSSLPFKAENYWRGAIRTPIKSMIGQRRNDPVVKPKARSLEETLGLDA